MVAGKLKATKNSHGKNTVLVKEKHGITKEIKFADEYIYYR